MKISFISSNSNINFKSRRIERNETIDKLCRAADKLQIQDEDDYQKINKLIYSAPYFKHLGTGSEGEVYQIPYTNLAIKVMSEIENPKKIKPITTNVTKEDELNNILAKSKDDSYRILRLIEGVHNEQARYSKSDEEYSIIVNNMSQKAHDEYL